MIFNIVVSVIVISLAFFTLGIFLELKLQIEKMRKEKVWTMGQFGKVNEAINLIIKLVWPVKENDEDKRNLN